MEDQIKQSLNLFSQEYPSPKADRFVMTRYNKSNSFTELSDWNNKHRYLNQSISLPKINQHLQAQKIKRQAKSQNSDYQNYKKQNNNYSVKPVQIQFGLPNGLKGFQKSFYENYLKQKTKKYFRSKPNEYLYMQQQGRRRSLEKKHQSQAKTEREVAQLNIVNRILHRKNKLKRQHFLQQFLVATHMGKKQQRQI